MANGYGWENGAQNMGHSGDRLLAPEVAKGFVIRRQAEGVVVLGGTGRYVFPERVGMTHVVLYQHSDGTWRPDGLTGHPRSGARYGMVVCCIPIDAAV